LPLPHRRTFAAGILPFAHSEVPGASAGTDPPQADWSACAGHLRRLLGQGQPLPGCRRRGAAAWRAFY